MLVKMILQLLCTVVLVAYAQKIDENFMNSGQEPLLLNTIQLTRSNLYNENFPDRIKAINERLSPENLILMRKLKMAIIYLDNLINNEACYNASSKVSRSELYGTNFLKVINFNRNYVKNEEELILMNSECELSMLDYEELFKNIYSTFLEYLKYFPMQFNNQKYTKCYFKSFNRLFQTPNQNHFDIFLSNKVEDTLVFFKNKVINNWENLKQCIPSQWTNQLSSIIYLTSPKIPKTILFSDPNDKHGFFKSLMQIATFYIKRIMDFKDCNDILMYRRLKIGKSNYHDVVALITRETINIYQPGEKAFPISLQQTIRNKIDKLMPLECEPELYDNKETFEKIHTFFELLKNDTTNYSDDAEGQAVITELKIVDEKIDDFIRNRNDIDRVTLNKVIENGIANLKSRICNAL